MNNTSNRFTNRLINEISPYLLQHAHNPVDWYPWSEEAFHKAQKENKPIFLSIGYSTCHWCHVMENESFENEEVARLLNDSFINIKVDREERPDIDNIYMSVCQMLTGSGGWPLTVIMTPDQKPFFAGTYFPKTSRGNRIGMMELIPRINDAWRDQKSQIYKSAEEITDRLNISVTIDENDSFSPSIIDEAFAIFSERFDKHFGGFGERPKFPSPHNLLFLLRYFSNSNDDKSLNMVIKTLVEMRKGGIFDHIGYGFHRYSTDKKWFLPHFEKMLYDQAMLTIAYTEAYQLTKIKLFKQTAEEIIQYVLRDLTSAEGGFYSAEDADSEGEEGKFYLWKENEIIELLGKKEGKFISQLFNTSESGNYSEESTGEFTGTNILFLTDTPENLASKFSISEIELADKINSARIKLFHERETRIHPYKDDKILTDWNGLMIAALAKASRIFNDHNYTQSAQKSLKFIMNKLTSKDGNLLHRYRDGEAAINGQIDDYSFTIWGMLELYESTFDIEYLKYSISYADFLIGNFWDEENNSGFYFTSAVEKELISRPKEFYDGAIPSGNSVMYMNLLKLNKITANPKYLELANKLSLAYKNLVERAPTGFSQFLAGLQFSLEDSYEILIVGDKNSPKTTEILEVINSRFIPNKVVMLLDNDQKEEMAKIADYTKDYTYIEGETTVYVCKNYVCSLPTTDKKKILELLSK